MARETRTSEEIEEHYKQKAIRLQAAAEHAAQRPARLAERRAIRDKKNLKAKARRLHKKGRYNYDKLSPEKKAAIAAQRPWDL